MAGTVYDRHAAFYLDFVDRGLARQTGRANLLLSTLVDCLSERLSGARVLDLCCGEGYLGRYLLTRGARAVVGIDLSSALIEEAERRADSPALTYRVDDAQSLSSEAEGAFDVVVSQMAMMDVADHKSLFASVRRVLVRGGPFVFSLLHPCFMAPCHVTEAPPLTLDDAGRPLAVSVRRYGTEGHWNSGGDGVRGHMGAYHRMVSTYVNDLIAGGFVLERLAEPLAGDDASQAGLAAEVPTVLVISARAA